MVKNLVFILLLLGGTSFPAIDNLYPLGYWIQNDLDVPLKIFIGRACQRSIMIEPGDAQFVLEQIRKTEWSIHFDFENFFYEIELIPHSNSWSILGQHQLNRSDFYHPLSKISSGTIDGLIIRPSSLFPGKIIVDEFQHP